MIFIDYLLISKLYSMGLVLTSFSRTAWFGIYRIQGKAGITRDIKFGDSKGKHFIHGLWLSRAFL